MKVKCYSVRLKSLTLISPKCYKAIDFSGNEALIPASQVFGQDYSVTKSDAFWISAWVLEKKDIMYSEKKEAWYNPETRQLEPKIIIERHAPERVDPVASNHIPELKK